MEITDSAETSILPEYPWGKATLVSSSAWLLTIVLFPSPFAFIFLAPILPLNLVLQRVLIHPARRWPSLTRHWAITALSSALVFALPLLAEGWRHRTTGARFRQFVFNPIPAGVSDLSKQEAMGIDGWITINFALTPATAEALLASRPWQRIDFGDYPNELIRDNEEMMRRRLGSTAKNIDLPAAEFFRVYDPAGGETFNLILSKDRSRACFIYSRT